MKQRLKPSKIDLVRLSKRILFVFLGLWIGFSGYAQTNTDSQEARRIFMDGVSSLTEGNTAQAKSLFSNAIILDSTQSDYFKLRGICELDLENNLDALRDFNQAIALNPRRPEQAFSLRGEAKTRMGKYDEAFLDHEKALAASPENQQFHFYRGKTHLLSGNYKSALADFTQAKGGVSGVEYLKYNGLTLVRLGKVAEGCADMRAAVNAGARGLEEFIGEYCTTQQPESEWETLAGTVITQETAANILSFENTPESIVRYYFASLIRKDDLGENVLPVAEKRSERLNRSLQKYAEWDFKEVYAKSQQFYAQGACWVKVHLTFTVESNGVTKTESGTDEVTLKKIAGKWVIADLPN